MERYIDKVMKLTHPIRFRQDLLPQYQSYCKLKTLHSQKQSVSSCPRSSVSGQRDFSQYSDNCSLLTLDGPHAFVSGAPSGWTELFQIQTMVVHLQLLPSQITGSDEGVQLKFET